MSQSEGPRSSTLRIAIGTLAFGLFVGPGPVVGLVPWLITRWRTDEPFLGWVGFRWLGAFVVAGGGLLLLDSFVRFVRRGRGTPAPVAPPEHLVATGPYRFVRNPMYLGVVAMILGQALLLGSGWLLMYAAGVWVVLELFLLLYEEPNLRRRFGPDHDEYRRSAGRWLPRLRPPVAPRSRRHVPQ
jgi:protein-S-isoprenylcysteine O-methyltransferase Ste14